MKFGQNDIPAELFELARERMRRNITFTPEDIRTHLLTSAKPTLAAINAIEHNWWIIANRVFRACLAEMRDTGEITQLKRGVWVRASSLVDVD